MLSTRLPRLAAGAVLLVCVVAAGSLANGAGAGAVAGVAGPMSLRDDLLYAELMVHEGTPYAPFFDGRRVRVVLAVEDEAFDRVQAAIASLGGSTQHAEREIGYLRAAIPFRSWPKVRLLDGVRAANIDGPLVPLERDTRPEPRAGEQKEPGLRENDPVPAGRPVLTTSDIAAVRRTSSHDALGLSRLWDAHPTFDGRGVGIAIVEPLTGNAAFSHPALQRAWDVAGRIIPKTADFVLPESSPRRVKADVEFTAGETFAWLPVGVARLPHTGTFRWGTSLLPSGPLTVLWDAASGEVWIDINRDLDYRYDETLRDARLDPASMIAVTGIGEIRVTLSRDRREVRLHFGKQSHPTMTSSVAAGAERDGIAGTAPGARLIFVELGDTAPTNVRFGGSPSAVIEALVAAARHPDVDIISMSVVSLVEQPTAGTDAVSILTRRIVDRYNKPIIKAASNGGALTTINTLGDAALSVGAFFPMSSAQRYLGASGTLDVVPHFSSRGPRQDGAAFPNVVGPIGEPSAAPCRPPVSSDRRVPFFKLPACYELSAGTSSAAPAIAGLAASLLSGLKQTQRQPTADALYAALRAAARPVPDAVTAQGAGIPQADVAWSLLMRDGDDVETTHVESSAPVIHNLQSYLPGERQGPGLFEREGWRAGQTGRRSMTIRRESGPDVLPYELSLTGDIATFSVPRRLVTHKGVDAIVPIDIRAGRTGVYAARLALRDPSGRTQAIDRQLTIVAADQLPQPGSKTPKRTYAGSLREFESRLLPIHVPAGIDALRFELDASEEVAVQVQDPAGLTLRGSDLVESRRSTKAGRKFLVPQPMAGTWIVSAYRGGREDLAVVAGDLTYTLDVAGVTHRSRGARIEMTGPADIDVMSYRARTTSATAEVTVDTPVTLPFTVEEGVTLAQWRVEAAGAGRVHAYLYDCSSGSCARHDAGGPASAVYTANVERPSPGRWMLAVTAGPRAAESQRFTVDFSVAATAGEKAQPTCSNDGESRSLLLQLMPRSAAAKEKEKNVTAAVLPAVRLMPCDAVPTPTMIQGSRLR